MNFTRIALAAGAAFIAYFMVGGIFIGVPALKTEFQKHSALYRSGDSSKSAMAVGMFGILLAIAAATVIFARMHPAGAGIESGLKYGAVLALFQIGSFVLHNHMMLNISARLSALQAMVYTSEWIAVGAVISLVYRG